MKKLALSLFLIFIAYAGIAQVTGGGVNEQQSSAKNSSSSSKVRYLMVSMLSPTGDYGADVLTAPSGVNAMGAKTGVGFQLGGYKYGINIPVENLDLGLYTSFSVGLNNFDWGFEDAVQIPFFMGEFKLGPVISYAITQDIFIDGFFKIGPMFSYGGAIDIDDNGNWDSFNEKPGLGIKTGFGANIRISNFVIGAEYNPAAFDMEYASQEDLDYSSAIEVPNNTFRLSIGILSFL